jgi:hypothetical protein
MVLEYLIVFFPIVNGNLTAPKESFGQSTQSVRKGRKAIDLQLFAFFADFAVANLSTLITSK